MPAAKPRAWGAPSAAFLLWMLVGFSAVFWWLRLGPGSGGLAVPVAPAPLPQVDAAAIGRFLAGEAASPNPVAGAPTPARFLLLGVAASPSQRGTALISVDGKPARPYRVGAEIDAGLVLQAVAPRSAKLGASVGGPSSITLDMPAARPRVAGAAAVPLPPPRFAPQAPVPAPGAPPLSQIAPENSIPLPRRP